MLTKYKTKSINSNNNYEETDGNGQNTICIHHIEYTTTATIVNIRFTTKYTLDIRPEKQNNVINSSKVHQKYSKRSNK